MFTAPFAPNVYSGLAVCVLFLHMLFILWVVFGALLTLSRPVLRWLHIVSLVWGILTELLPWPCPLTVLENWLEAKAGVQPYQDGFLLHYHQPSQASPDHAQHFERDFRMSQAKRFEILLADEEERGILDCRH